MKTSKSGAFSSIGTTMGSMNTRSAIILNYISAKIEFDAMIDDSDIRSLDINHMRNSITDEVFPGLFEEAFGEIPKGLVAVGVCHQGGSNVIVIYASERFLKPATAVSSASAKFGLSDKTTDDILVSTTFKKSVYLKYQYLIQLRREEIPDGHTGQVYSESVDDDDLLPF